MLSQSSPEPFKPEPIKAGVDTTRRDAVPAMPRPAWPQPQRHPDLRVGRRLPRRIKARDATGRPMGSPGSIAAHCRAPSGTQGESDRTNLAWIAEIEPDCARPDRPAGEAAVALGQPEFAGETDRVGAPVHAVGAVGRLPTRCGRRRAEKRLEIEDAGG